MRMIPHVTRTIRMNDIQDEDFLKEILLDIQKRWDKLDRAFPPNIGSVSQKVIYDAVETLLTQKQWWIEEWKVCKALHEALNEDFRRHIHMEYLLLRRT